MELAKPIGLRLLNPLYGMANFFEFYLTAQVENYQVMEVVTSTDRLGDDNHIIFESHDELFREETKIENKIP